MIVGDKIRKIRELKGISPKAIADELEMTLAGYHKIERGDVDINTEKLEKISAALGVKTTELLSFDEKNVFNAENQQNFLNNYQLNYYNSTKILEIQEKYIAVLEQKIAMLEKELGK